MYSTYTTTGPPRGCCSPNRSNNPQPNNDLSARTTLVRSSCWYYSHRALIWTHIDARTQTNFNLLTQNEIGTFFLNDLASLLTRTQSMTTVSPFYFSRIHFRDLQFENPLFKLAFYPSFSDTRQKSPSQQHTYTFAQGSGGHKLAFIHYSLRPPAKIVSLPHGLVGRLKQILGAALTRSEVLMSRWGARFLFDNPGRLLRTSQNRHFLPESHSTCRKGPAVKNRRFQKWLPFWQQAGHFLLSGVFLQQHFSLVLFPFPKERND